MYRLLKERELVEYLNGAFSLSWIRHCRLTGGGIPFLKIGHAVRYRQCDVEAWLVSRKRFIKTSDYGDDSLAEMIKLELEPPPEVKADMVFARKIKDGMKPPKP